MVKTHYTPISKPAPARESHQSIQAQTQRFLENGGKIQTIAEGMTGQAGISTKKFTVVNHLSNKNKYKKPAQKVKSKKTLH